MAYLEYFHKVVLAPGATNLKHPREIHFLVEYNINTSLTPGKQQPEMLNRFLLESSSTLIHAGYGSEFGLPGMLC